MNGTTADRDRLARMVLTLVTLALFLQGAVRAQTPEPKLDSPRLAALWQELKAGNAAALDSFYVEIKGKAPLVEPIPGDDQNVRVTFVRRAGDNVRLIFLDGGLPAEAINKQLFRLGDTNLWFRTERLPADARFYYDFGVLSGSSKQPSYNSDPFNSRGGAVELPGAPAAPLLQPQANVPSGKVTINQKLTSPILNGTTRIFTIYTPPGYDPAGEPYGLLIMFDGELYRDPKLMAGPIVLDNLIAKQQIRPLVAVFLNTQNATRTRDLANSPNFADFVAEELVPWVRQNYHVSTDPRRTILGGLSLGGLMSAYCAFRHPEVIGNVLSQSGSFWVWEGWPKVEAKPVEVETGWLTRRFATTQQLPLRFYLEVGRLEEYFDAMQSLENRRFRDVLEAKGYPVTYREVNSDHSPLNWRSTFPEGLIALAAPPNPQ
jgi:enterochelin esterase-like enzyme